MLTIVTVGNRQTEWHVGEIARIPELKLLANDVSFIQADGDELDRIAINFPALTSRQRVVRWYGDLAKTILWNTLF